MFSRVRGFLGNSHPGDTVQLQLLHGHASLSAEFEVLRRNGERIFSPQYPGVEVDSSRLGVAAAEWFTYRKRGLLAAFGVGTIDQALLAGLRTRHVFVRLFGLSGKAVVIDEVHAYDTYMTTLLERLLEWLAALGSPVVLLSATLPRGRKSALLSAYQRGLGQDTPPAAPEEAGYPRISWALGNSKAISQSVRVSRRSEKAIRMETIGSSPAPQEDPLLELGDFLEENLAQGGCAAVVCNTVRRAQDVYHALKPRFQRRAEDGHPELDILHSQYPFHTREEREERVLARFGHPGAPRVLRPHRSILVATQIIEQSLDLDFDLMVSDMAPADLLLQRAGRLHRHERPSRPPGLEKPRLLLLCPDMSGAAPRFDRGAAAVYDRHVLLRSWMSLAGRQIIRVPDDVEAIIEYVYGDNHGNHGPDGLTGPLRDMWHETLQELQADRDREKREAEERWIRSPPTAGSSGASPRTPGGGCARLPCCPPGVDQAHVTQRSIHHALRQPRWGLAGCGAHPAGRPVRHAAGRRHEAAPEPLGQYHGPACGFRTPRGGDPVGLAQVPPAEKLQSGLSQRRGHCQFRQVRPVSGPRNRREGLQPRRRRVSFDGIQSYRRPWIPCTMADGRQEMLGIRDVLARAPSVTEIRGETPLVVASLHRLLLAILYRNFRVEDTGQWADLRGQAAWRAPVLNEYLAQWHNRFNLFDDERPFYQAAGLDLSKGGSSARLLFHADNNPTLFTHLSTSARPELTPAEAARLLVGFMAFDVGGTKTSERGQESAKAAPLNKGAVILPRGGNLFETLMLSMCRYVPEDGDPWRLPPGPGPPSVGAGRVRPARRTGVPDGYLDLLTWQSRRIRLQPEPGEAGSDRREGTWSS